MSYLTRAQKVVVTYVSIFDLSSSDTSRTERDRLERLEFTTGKVKF